MEKKIEPKMDKMELHISELIDLDKVKFVREYLMQTNHISNDYFDDVMVQIREALEGFGVNTDK